ncbi:MAG: DinB family protein, partial [Candidatus Eisenbacteria bacterium]
MSGIVRTALVTPGGFASREVARFLWQMDEQRRRLAADTRDLSAEDLAWQIRPGMNTIGMLLAHIAFAETNLAQVGLLGETKGHPHDVIGLA